MRLAFMGRSTITNRANADLLIAFYSKKLGQHELNWQAHDKNLYAIKQRIAKWRPYLHDAKLELFTDNLACK